MLCLAGVVMRLAFFGAAIALAAVACQSEDATTAPVSSSSGTAPAPTPKADEPRTTPQRDAAAPRPDVDEDAEAPPPPMVVTHESLDVLGAPRAFVLAAPSTYTPETTYPLVLVLHGDGGDGPTMRAAFPFDEISRQSAFVAYLTGTHGWNLYEPADGNLDLAYIAAVVESLSSRFTVDTSRVFGIGFSSGAFMLNQVACRRPALLKAIVPHSGGAPNEPRDPTASRWENDYTRCANQTLGSGPAVLVVHGMADTDVTFDSGDFTAKYWAFINGCASTRSTPTTPSPCVLHDGCPTGKPVGFCAIDALAHTVWSDAATAAWQFFEPL